MAGHDERPTLRIGELSRRLGVTDHLLRAWESRYGLLHPVRSSGGYRLYSEADVDRVRRMQEQLAAGLAAAEAARVVLADTTGASGDPAPPAEDVAVLLRRALDAFDEAAAQAALDRLFAERSLPSALRDVVMPYLAELGDRWQAGTASVAQEHFASFVLRGRLAGLARGWGSGRGPLALLACPPLELHDLALLAFGIVLNRQGWRISYLGASTPMAELVRAAESTGPQLVVLAASHPEMIEPYRAELTSLASRLPLALAGAGATPDLARAVGARLLGGDPVTEAEQLASA